MEECSRSPTRKPSRFSISFRVWIGLVAIISVVLGLTYRRESIRPSSVEKLTQVAMMPDNDIYKVAWSPDRQRLAVIGWEQPVEVRDPLSLGLVQTIGTGKKIIDFAFSNRSDVVAYTENDRSNSSKILYRSTGKLLNLPTGNMQPSVVFSNDGCFLATGGYGTQVKLWSVADGSLVRQFDAGPAVGGLTPRFSPDGKTLAVGNRNGSPILFETATGKRILELDGRSTQELQFHPDGQTIAVTRVDGSLAICRVSDGRILAERFRVAEDLYTVDWSPDGAILASAGREGKITLWNPGDLTVIRELDAPEWVIRVRFSPDGLNLHYAGGDGKPRGPRHLGVLGVEGSLYTLLHRSR